MPILRNCNVAPVAGRVTHDIVNTGKLGSQIPATGQNGAGYLYNDVTTYSLQSNEVSGRIVSTTLPSGSWFAWNDSRLEVLGSVPDGQYLLEYLLKIDGVPQTPNGVITYNAGVSPPAITTQPQAQSVNESQTATFTVVASGTAPLSYQWQRQPNGGSTYSNVTGGTGGTTASYTTPATTVTGGLANNGDTYRVVVTNGVGNVTSTPAGLAVSVVTDGSAPTLTGTLTASNITPTSFRLSWPAATDNIGVAGYELSLDNGVTYNDVGIVLLFDVTGRTPGVTYQCRVRARDAAGNRSAALVAAVTTTNTSVVTKIISNGSGFPLAGVTLNYTFVQLGRIGNMTGKILSEGSVLTNGSGIATITGLPPVKGILLMARYQTVGTSDETTDDVYYEAVTVT